MQLFCECAQSDQEQSPPDTRKSSLSHPKPCHFSTKGDIKIDKINTKKSSLTSRKKTVKTKRKESKHTGRLGID